MAAFIELGGSLLEPEQPLRRIDQYLCPAKSGGDLIEIVVVVPPLASPDGAVVSA
ncbi:MAG: hypothetical protein ACJAYU_001188 [Bradymonadia bacterium]|jgi:hypothetical protein